ncbi:MAG: SCO1664 family protein [Caldilineaceae bacterium SB0665_bin_25]|nr:SCO1664 family protein [Caldilineaceae bacterium SB0665_bin_25]
MRNKEDSCVVDGGGPAATAAGEILSALAEGTIEEKGLLPYSSNYTFLATVHYHQHEIPAVYKPRRGENPLWDFPAGTLCQRETAAFVVSEALGWRLVPPTVLRDGPRGPGSIQFFIECDPDIHYFNMREDARYAPALRRLTLFDYLINNADRKAGHCLYETAREEREERTANSPLTPRPAHMWAIDHGICFHHQYKLRTVIWEFAGETIEEGLLADLESLKGLVDTGPVHSTLGLLLSVPELDALRRRISELLSSRQYPSPPVHQRNYPWPPI